MISLKSYILRDGDPETEDAYRHIIDLMAQGLAVHAVQGEQSAYERFRADIDQFAAVLGADVKPAELLTAAGGMVSALGEYNRSTTAFIQRQNTELQHMVSMLTQTILKIGASSADSAAKLREIEKELVQACMSEEIQLLKIRLRECLDTVHAEAERQKADSQIAMAKLEQELSGSRERIGSIAEPKEADPVTGLPSKKEAEQALRSAVASPEGKFVLIAVVSRVNAVNSRFGYAIGDRILSTCAEYFRSKLSACDELYRWQGPAFLAILSRSRRIDEVRGEIRRFADARLEENVEVGNRTVLIPVSSNWSVMPTSPPFEALHKKIEAFTAAQVPREYA